MFWNVTKEGLASVRRACGGTGSVAAVSKTDDLTRVAAKLAQVVRTDETRNKTAAVLPRRVVPDAGTTRVEVILDSNGTLKETYSLLADAEAGNAGRTTVFVHTGSEILAVAPHGGTVPRPVQWRSVTQDASNVITVSGHAAGVGMVLRTLTADKSTASVRASVSIRADVHGSTPPAVASVDDWFVAAAGPEAPMGSRPVVWSPSLKRGDDDFAPHWFPNCGLPCRIGPSTH